ncbi:MAG TPA: AbrB/MazE/SpoVT family DNA-binding domain-containing protein [Methylomirabilota bacterium]|nr:AbrB/MazE/SpoVT family DNA-binding domain-containing protein [Methylomirabilota bacterium]
MAKVTSKLQVTVPKAIAVQYGIRPGDEIDWVPAGDSIRVVPAGRGGAGAADLQSRLKLFDAATERQRLRQSKRPRRRARGDRGWTREDLYDRARPR